MISLVDRRPAWRRSAGAQQRRLPVRQERLAEIINLAKNLDDPIQHHRLRHSAMAAYLKKPPSHNPLIARKPLIRVDLACPTVKAMITGQQLRDKFLSPAMKHYFDMKLAPLSSEEVDVRIEEALKFLNMAAHIRGG